LPTFSNSDILSEDIIYGALANINYSSELILDIFEAFLSFKMSRINPLPDGTTRLENNQAVPFFRQAVRWKNGKWLILLHPWI